MPGAPPIPANRAGNTVAHQQLQRVSTVDLYRQQLAQKYAAAINRNGGSQPASLTKKENRFADRRCWVCRVETGSMMYDRRDLCLECGEEVLRHVLLPLLAPSLQEVDTTVEMNITDAERTMTASPISPPTTDIIPLSSSAWTCWNCKAIQLDSVEQCSCCRKQRPPEAVCCRCEENILVVKKCATTRREHVQWQCSHCSLANTEEAVECRGCHSGRKWYCGSCSLENPWTRRHCDACGGDHKLDNVSSVVNREFLNQMGFSSDAQSLHRQQQKQVELLKEHTRRLEQRVDKLGLLPIPIDDDGNCLFRALSYQLVRTDVFFPIVRHMIVDHMEAHQSEYALLVGGDDFESYVSGMRRNTIWGDELCVHAASRIFGAHIHVITSDESRWHLRYEHSDHRRPSLDAQSQQHQHQLQRRLFLCYRSPDHYYCVVHPTKEPKSRTLDLEATLRQFLPPTEQAQLDSVLLQRRSSGGDLGASVNSSASSFGGGKTTTVLPPSPQRSPMAPSNGSFGPPVVPQKLPPNTFPPRHSPPTTQEIPRYTYSPQQQQQQLPPPPANPPPRTGNVHVVLGGKPPRSDSPPMIRRGAETLPTTSTSNTIPPHQQQQQLPRTANGDELRSRVERTPQGPTAASSTPISAAAQLNVAQINAALGAHGNQQRPVTRSLRLEVLQFEHFRLLPHPIMVRLYVAGSPDLGLHVTQQETVRQGREATFLYLYSIQPRIILDGGPDRYPWKSIYQQTTQYVDEARRSQRNLMPLFLLQHIQSGGFISPGDDMTSRTVFAELGPVPCAPLVCRTTTDLASSLLVVDDVNTTSRSKLHLKFFKKELMCPNISFVAGGNDMFCCQYAVSGSQLVVHQLFSGAPERLCLRCNQYYQYHGRRGGSHDNTNTQPHQQTQRGDTGGVDHGRSPGGCNHFSQVDEIMEVISRY
ncbi:Hypothetical protein, putative [Bodo saltans]|uniref:OTU domain-containing protein n=1 Tax=Bodo saltans TaxID=75058 RepID=A0A0S4JFP3_BODSA|nr:Hypothetical protein, putative [Bodo saltans]|eukprot:CUG90371.1 Hypothetical protein, putative [Bodo saltans]